MSFRQIYQSIVNPNAVQEQITARANAQANALTHLAVQKIKAQLGYTSTGFAGFMSGGEKSPYGISGSGGGIFLNHALVRQNARTAYIDSTQAKALVTRFADTVADVGLRLEAVPVANLLGITQERAESWSEDVEQRFDLFCKDKKQHRSEGLTFYQAHHLYQIFQHRDGDMFVRLYYSRDTRLQNRLQFEFIDPNQIAGTGFTTTTMPGIYSIDGIERDERRREKSYNVFIYKPDGHIEYKTITRVNAKSGRLMMLHGFVPEFAGQGRGYSRLLSALQEFQKLTDFTLAHIQKAVISSQINMFVKPSDDSPANDPLADVLINRGAGPAAQQFGVDPTPAEDAVNVDEVGYAALPEAAFRQPGSVGVFNLNKGEDLKPFDAKTPSSSFDTFVDSFTAHLCAALSMPIEVLLMKFNANYSASRAALMLFWRVAVMWRDEMAADFLDPVYQMWMSEEIAAGRIKAPGWSDPRLRQAWLNNNWIGPPMPNIDPIRTAKADQTYVEMGATDLDRVARNHNGSSGKANRAKLKRQYDELPASPFSKKAGT